MQYRISYFSRNNNGFRTCEWLFSVVSTTCKKTFFNIFLEEPFPSNLLSHGNIDRKPSSLIEVSDKANIHFDAFS